MSAIDDALAANRLRLATALWDHPKLRETLTYAEILTAVDTAFTSLALPALVATAAAAEVVVAAVIADVATPPSSVTGAIGGYTPARDDAGGTWQVFEP